jgi:hypothetical protein
LLVQTSSAVDKFVDDSAPPGGTGNSWASPYDSLQTAIATTSSGDTIFVAQGTYKPSTTGNPVESFVLNDDVIWQGGYAGFGAADPNARDIAAFVTILSGDLGGDDVFTQGASGQPNTYTNYGENSIHVVTGSQALDGAVMDGFTVRSANGGGARFSSSASSSPSPLINNCRFIESCIIQQRRRRH